MTRRARTRVRCDAAAFPLIVGNIHQENSRPTQFYCQYFGPGTRHVTLSSGLGLHPQTRLTCLATGKLVAVLSIMSLVWAFRDCRKRGNGVSGPRAGYINTAGGAPLKQRAFQRLDDASALAITTGEGDLNETLFDALGLHSDYRGLLPI
jgi:hypothetical protein